jgi:hypothetical protein
MKTIVKTITAVSLVALAAPAFAAQELSSGQLDGITAGYVALTPAYATSGGSQGTQADATSSADPFVATSADGKANTYGKKGTAIVILNNGGGVHGTSFGGKSESTAIIKLDGKGSHSKGHHSKGPSNVFANAEAGGGGSGNGGGVATIDTQAKATPYKAGSSADVFVTASGYHGASAGASSSTITIVH